MVYYRLIRGDVCTWGMLKDPQATAPEDDRKSWTYVDWRKHAQRLAKEEDDQAAEEGREDCGDIKEIRMAEFEEWWRIEEKKDAQLGGAKATAARGYSLLGTRTVLPAFMSRQVELGNPLSTGLSQLKLDEPSSSTRVANTRQRFGKDASEGRPDLDAKRMVNQHGKSKKTATAILGNDKGRKGRKTRHANGGQDAGLPAVIPENSA